MRHGAVEIIDETRQAMIERRSDKEFRQALVDARGLCDGIQIEAEFPQVREVRPRKKRSNMIMNLKTRLLQVQRGDSSKLLFLYSRRHNQVFARMLRTINPLRTAARKTHVFVWPTFLNARVCSGPAHFF
ncbi:hypothetical protein AVEN_96986-1 [Araneus ventricosus]|uniref:Uncharacterized protein n=1 Tax=Araneus ventricosus TaxID=182803 RepID=A0A4Y2PRC6_ARAVE|nr:hypothetical protein AVEN_96986-1 [Araneus ventricosus]